MLVVFVSLTARPAGRAVSFGINVESSRTNRANLPRNELKARRHRIIF